MREFLKYVPYEEVRSMNALVSTTAETPEHIPLISFMGSVQGEVLEHLEIHGEATLRGILKALHYPTHIVTMAVGALVYGGLVKAVQGKKFIRIWVNLQS